jgi:hypothetical protein
VLGTCVIKVNDDFTLNDVALVNNLRYNLLSISQLVNADLNVLFHKSGLRVIDSSSKLVNADLDAPCNHGKMIAASHSLVNTVMIKQPGQLLHMDIVGPSWVRSMGGKWYVLVIVEDYSCYSWVFFLENKDKVFEHFRSLALRLNNEHPNYLKAIRSDNGTKFVNASFNQFCLEHGVDQ